MAGSCISQQLIYYFMLEIGHIFFFLGQILASTIYIHCIAQIYTRTNFGWGAHIYKMNYSQRRKSQSIVDAKSRHFGAMHCLTKSMLISPLIHGHYSLCVHECVHAFSSFLLDVRVCVCVWCVSGVLGCYSGCTVGAEFLSAVATLPFLQMFMFSVLWSFSFHSLCSSAHLKNGQTRQLENTMSGHFIAQIMRKFFIFALNDPLFFRKQCPIFDTCLLSRAGDCVCVSQ